MAGDQLRAVAARLGVAAFEPDASAVERWRLRAEQARRNLARLLGIDTSELAVRRHVEEPVQRLQGQLRSLDDARMSEVDPAGLRSWLVDAMRLENDTQEATARAIEGDRSLADSLPARRADVTARLIELTGAPRPSGEPATTAGDPLAEVRRLRAAAGIEAGRLAEAVVEYLEVTTLVQHAVDCVELDRQIVAFGNPADQRPAARLAMARRADERGARLREELTELLAPHGIDPGELLRTGSPDWEAWFGRYREARRDLVDLLDIGRGTAVDDDWIRHVFSAWHEEGCATPEMIAAERVLAETSTVARLVDDIHRLSTWARTVEEVEAELARYAEEAPRPADRAQLAARQRLEDGARDLVALGTALDGYAEEAFLYAPPRVLSAARQHSVASGESRRGILLLHARLRYLLSDAQDSENAPTRNVEELRRLASDVEAAVDHHETVRYLNAHLDATLDHLMRELAGVPAAERAHESFDLAGPGETMAGVRDHLARLRRRDLLVLQDGLIGEFAVDLVALDEPGAGMRDVARLSDVPPGESERLDATIELIHRLGRTRTQLTHLDTIIAAMDEADHRKRLEEVRLARLVSDHLRRYPLDRRIGRGKLEPDRMRMAAAARTCEAALPDGGWAESSLAEVRRRVAALWEDPESRDEAHLAERYLGLRRLIDTFDAGTPWIEWHLALAAHGRRLRDLMRRRDETRATHDAAEDRLRRLATRFGPDLAGWNTLSQVWKLLRHMMKRDLRWLTLVLGPDAPPELRRLDAVPAEKLNTDVMTPVLADMVLRAADRHPRNTEVRGRVIRAIALAGMIDVADEIRNLTAAVDRFDSDLSDLLHAAVETAGMRGGPEPEPPT